MYGLFQSKNKTLWVSPIAFELEIGRQTLLHEATHVEELSLWFIKTNWLAITYKSINKKRNPINSIKQIRQ